MTDEKEYSQKEVNIMTDEMIALRKEYERAAFKRGAEAMRETAAAEAYFYVSIGQDKNRVADKIRALSIPEYTDAP